MDNKQVHNGHKLLLHVDDDDVVHFITKKLIQAKNPGIEYQPYTSCKDALTALDSSNRVGAILLDLEMPVMNGWQFLDEMKFRQLSTPVFILSSSDHPFDKARANEYDCVMKYFVKPFAREHLDQIVTTMA